MSDLKTNKFKVGDKVRRISDAWDDMPLNSEWVVSVVVNDEEIKVTGDQHMEWLSEYFELVDGEEAEKDNVKGIPSDGGSSDYYFTKLPKHLINQIVETGGIETKDIIRYVFDNNADAFNIVKAQKRIVEANKGKGKLGITALYDMKKIVYFANEQLKASQMKEAQDGI